MLATRPAACRARFLPVPAGGTSLDVPGAGDVRAKPRGLQWNSSLTQKAYIWAHLRQRAALLIPSCGDMIKAWIKNWPVSQSFNTAACLHTIISPSASLALYCTGHAELSRCTGPGCGRISMMQCAIRPLYLVIYK